MLEKSRASDQPGLCVIDGGGNRPGLDQILSRAADLILIPCGIGGQDAPMALRDLERLPGAWIIVNRFPMTPGHRRWAKARTYIAQLPQEHILCRLGESAAADRFTESDARPWTTPPTRVNNAAHLLYHKIAEALSRD